MKSYCAKYSLQLSILFFVIAFCYSHLPFFLYTPIIFIGWDALDYFYCLEQIYNNELPRFDYLPAGFSLFVWFVFLFSKKILSVVIVQTLIFFFSSILLIFTFYKYLNLRLGLYFVSIALSIYAADAITLRFSTSLMTESIYVSSLMLLCSLLMSALYSQKKIFWILFSVCLILPGLIRTNGIYVYFLLPCLLAYLFVNNYEKKYYYFLSFPFIILNLLWATYNWKTYNMFFISNPARIIEGVEKFFPEKTFSYVPRDYGEYMVYGPNSGVNDTVLPAIINNNEVSKDTNLTASVNGKIEDTKGFFDYFSSYHKVFTRTKGTFYYLEISNRYYYLIGSYKYRNSKYKDYYYESGNYNALQLAKVFNGYYPVSLSLKKLILQEYYRDNEYGFANELFENKEQMYSFYSPADDVSTSNMTLREVYLNSYNLWFFSTFVLHLVYEKFFWNWVWYAAFYVALIWAIFQLIKTRFKSRFFFISVMLALLHFASIFFLSFLYDPSYSATIRYAHSTGFIIYLIPMLMFAYYFDKRNLV